MVELENVSKVYGNGPERVAALDRVSLSVTPGEFVAVRGPSGSGKTTLLLIVGGMIRPTEGRTLLDGHDLGAWSAARRASLRAARIGFVFQMYHLLPYLDVLENVLTPVLAGAHVTRPEALGLLERLGLATRIHHRPAELSAGERQRVALARALIKQPALLLADEPTGNLDPATAAQVMTTVADYHRAGGTVLVVTHDQLADGYAQRVLRLQRGHLVPPD
jgi:ABC-type lipoprotein export system ATPase subunit